MMREGRSGTSVATRRVVVMTGLDFGMNSVALGLDMPVCVYEHVCMAKTHGVTATTPLDLAEAEQVARLMSALGTASRVRILSQLRLAPCSVGALTEAVGMAQPAVSHQLRILRDLGLVDGTQQGRITVYALHDTHVSTLLDEALRHIEHLRSRSTTRPGS
jgi:DNA-binding transcriptional ArsR family regulator